MSANIDSDGWLTIYNEWSFDTAKELALIYKFEISDEHKEIFNFLRVYYEEHGELTDFKTTQKNIIKIVGNYKVSTEKFHSLFPDGINENTYKIAGIPKNGYKKNH